MKQLNFLRTWLLLLCLTLSTGVSWGEEVATFVMKNSGQSSPVTVNGVTFTWTSSNIVVGTNNGSGFKANSNMTVTIPAGKKITGIEKGNGNTWGSGAQIDVYAGNSSSGTKIATITKDTHTYSISSDNTGTTYYFANTTSKNAWLNTLTIKYDDNGESTTTKYAIIVDPTGLGETGNGLSVNGNYYSSYQYLKDAAAAGETVTLAASPKSGYMATNDCWNVYDANMQAVSVSGNGNNYSFTMPASNVSISPVYVAESVTPTPSQLATPTNLSATYVTATSAKLSWDAVANASSYELMVLDDQAYYVENERSVSGTSYELTGLNANTTYTWTVKAIGDGVNYADSEESDDVDFTTLAQSGGESGGGEGTTVSMTSFSAISGNVGGDANVSYEAAKGGASTEPAVNSNEIRVYQNGGLFTVTAATGYKLKSVTIGSSMATSINYKLDGGSEVLSSNASISAKGTYTASNLNNTSIQFICKGTTSSSRLYVNYLSVTYASDGDDSGSGETPSNVAPKFTEQPKGATYGQNATAMPLTVVAAGTPTPTYQWYSNTTNINKNGTALDGETNASFTPSTATIGTLYYYCVATNSAGSATSNVVAIIVNGAASLPFSFDGGKEDLDKTPGMTQYGLGSDYSASPKLKFDSQGDYVVINYGEDAKRVTYTIKGNSTSGTYAFDVMESVDGANYTLVHSHTSIADATSYTDALNTNSRYVKFVYTKKTSGNVALGKINIVAASYQADPELAFEKNSYKFAIGEDMQVVASSKVSSTGAITYALTSGNENDFAIDENTGEIVCYTAGTYTVTASIAATDDYKAGTATCQVEVIEPVVGNSIIVAEADGNVYAMTTTCAGDYFVHKSIKKVGNKYVVDSLGDILFCTNTADGKTTIQSTANNEYVQATAAKKVSYTESEYKWTNDGEKLTAATANYGTLQYNTGSPRFTTYTNKVGQYAYIVNLSDVVVGNVLTLNKACTDGELVYATYSSSKAFYVPENLIVSEIAIVDNLLYVESYKTGDIVPANTGVMVSAMEGGDYYVEIETDEDMISEFANSVLGNNNCLRPSGDDGITADAMAEADANCVYYRLTMHNGTQIGFWWGAADGAAFDLAKNKAYLAVPKGSNAKVNGVWVEAETNGISSVNEEVDSNETYYNIAGQRVNASHKGIVIVNGRKYINK